VAVRGRPFGSPAGSRSSSLSSFRRSAFFVGAAPNPPINRTASGSRLSATLGIGKCEAHSCLPALFECRSLMHSSAKPMHFNDELKCTGTIPRRPCTLDAPNVCQSVGPPLAHAGIPAVARKASSLCRSAASSVVRAVQHASHQVPPFAAEQARCFVRASGSRAAACTHGRVRQFTRGFCGRQAHGRYSVPSPAVVHASAWQLPNPSINRTCPGKPGPAGYLKR